MRPRNQLPRKIQLPPAKPGYLPMAGGLDIATPPFQIKPGFLKESKNWEAGISGGYGTIAGYERFNGRASPSDADYYVIYCTFSGTINTGTTVTGVSSGATGVVIASEPDGDNPYIAITKLDGEFESGEELIVSGAIRATTTTEAWLDGAPNVQTHWQLKAAAADAYRSDISAVPGSGPILGLVHLNGFDYAFRETESTAGDQVHIYRSTSTGWNFIPLGAYIKFQSGSTEISDGDTITGADSGASFTVTRVMLETGSWNGGDAAGKLVFAEYSGNFDLTENLQVDGSTVAVKASSPAEVETITLRAGGTFKFDRYNFNGQGTRIYGCDGVNPGFEFDGNVLAPISTGMTADQPTNVKVHKNHLFFAFGNSLQHSGITTPYAWTVISGAAEMLAADSITGFSTEGGSETGGALAVWCRNALHILYGSSSSDWNFIRYKGAIGARSNSIQQIGHTFVLDDRGMSTLQAVQAFGNFKDNSVSARVQKWLNARKNLLVGSCVCREKNQIRLFFSDNTALYVTISNGKVVGLMPCELEHTVNCVYSIEDDDGEEIIRFGGTDGYVYQMEKGTSFDGDAIDTLLITHYHHDKTPTLNKDYRDLMLEVEGEGFAILDVAGRFGYGDAYLSQPQGQQTEVGFAETAWDQFVWDQFYWDGQTLMPTLLPFRGQGTNMALIVRTNSNYFAPVHISGAVYQYLPRQQMRYSR